MADLKPWQRDLGNGIILGFTSWDPERDINPQWADEEEWPSVERYGASIRFPDGCCGIVTFDGPVARKHNERSLAVGRSESPLWTVESWEPLTLSPSVLDHGRGDCPGHHGFVREGRWVEA